MSAAAATPVTAPELETPSDKALAHAARFAIEKDMPIMLDYFMDTRDGRAFLGQDGTTGEKMLVRSEEEFTSPISNLFRVGADLIAITENSIYIVSAAIKKRIISLPTA